MRLVTRTPVRSLRWLRPHSIRVRLSSVFALLVLLVIGLGLFAIKQLGDVNHDSEEIRNHWLQDARILGDLSNYMSDYRTAEATRLLSVRPLEIAASERELSSLDRIVSSNQRSFEAVPQYPSESRVYALFAQQWSAYKEIAARVLGLARDHRNPEAVVMYMTDSRRAFDLASDTLTRLTDQTVAKARGASARAADTYERSRALIFAAMAVAGSILIAGIVYVTRSIINPLHELALRMNDLADHDTGIEIPGTGREDEMGEMARTVAVFRENALALMNSQRRIQEQASTLDRALENEQRLTAKQRNFVSMSSHEFRTPLTIIDGHAQRLIKLADRLVPADIRDRGARIRSAVLRMTGVMESLLAASRLLDGQAVFQPTEFDLPALLREICQVHREATRGANIDERYEDLPRTLCGDPKLLFHAFSNLVSNAIKYSPQGSPIVVTAARDGDHVVVRVLDHGIGIPARDRKHLFERYFRGTNATAIAGTGVGLHLVAMVVDLHHGDVAAESLEGVGSTFIVRLPVQATAVEEHAAANSSVA